MTEAITVKLLLTFNPKYEAFISVTQYIIVVSLVEISC